MIVRVLKHIAAFRNRPSQRLLDTIYGPHALPLRTQCAALMLDRKVTGSSKEAQFGSLRKALLKAVGATGECIASEDADFEAQSCRVNRITFRTGIARPGLPCEEE